jgi:predicted enzyme related to lactoylglutathione lyase
MQANPVIWFEIHVQDMNRAKAFYQTVLQRTLEKLNTPDLEYWAFPMDTHCVGTAGALVKMDGVASGGNLHKEKMSIGEYGFIALAVDTEGNLFGLHSMK